MKGILVAAILFAAVRPTTAQLLVLPDRPPQVSKERIVLTTEYGDLVLALYPAVAPLHVKQVLQLVRLGAYDTTHFMWIDPKLALQLSSVQSRLQPLTPEQAAAERPLPLEVSPWIRHLKGRISMVRRTDDPDSATSAFAITLQDLPQFDNERTVIGHIESGGLVVNRILAEPRDEVIPRTRLNVERAWVAADAASYYATHPYDPVDVMGLEPRQRIQVEFIWLALTVIVVTLIGFLLYDHISKRVLLAFSLMNVLILGFGLMITAVPAGQSTPAISILIFIALLGLFKLMNRFEAE